MTRLQPAQVRAWLSLSLPLSLPRSHITETQTLMPPREPAAEMCDTVAPSPRRRHGNMWETEMMPSWQLSTTAPSRRCGTTSRRVWCAWKGSDLPRPDAAASGWSMTPRQSHTAFGCCISFHGISP
ncbi:hypothetical protein LY76DRAFT_592114 [Colletotrichum caudatum]|nr:hypothetical protein LY76DRAFT_592114 [Colletotrichum caudatum]